MINFNPMPINMGYGSNSPIHWLHSRTPFPNAVTAASKILAALTQIEAPNN